MNRNRTVIRTFTTIESVRRKQVSHSFIIDRNRRIETESIFIPKLAAGSFLKAPKNDKLPKKGRPSFLQDTTLHRHNSTHTTLHGPFLHTHNSIRHSSTPPQFDTQQLDTSQFDTKHFDTLQLDTSQLDTA